MSELIIIGPPQSSYVRTVRIACGEKGVAHTLQPIELGSDAHLAVHPWGKVPAMKHGDVALYEASAIVRYIDDAFDGTSLTPADPARRAVMEQWISVLNSYIYADAIRDYSLQYIFPRGEGGKPDRAKIDDAVPRLKRSLGLLDDAYGTSAWLAGDQLSLADLFAAPIIATAKNFPEAGDMIASCMNLSRAFGAIESRDSYKAALPPPFPS